MKKSLTKLIVSCAAVTAVAAAMAVSASAATTVDETKTTITNGLTSPVAAGTQATILVQKKTDSALTEGDIFFIDQQAYAEGLWATIPVATALENGTYTIKMGGTDATVVAEDFTVGEVAGEKVLLGNVIGDEAVVDSTDALVILRFSADDAGAKQVINTPKQEFIANINGDKKDDGSANVDTTDALIALRSSVLDDVKETYIKEVDYIAE